VCGVLLISAHFLVGIICTSADESVINMLINMYFFSAGRASALADQSVWYAHQCTFSRRHFQCLGLKKEQSRSAFSM
jgi:hypothetical protein